MQMDAGLRESQNLDSTGVSMGFCPSPDTFVQFIQKLHSAI